MAEKLPHRAETVPPPGHPGLAPHADDDDRRGFLKKAAAVAAGTLAALAPLGAGIVFLLDPLRRTVFVPVTRRKKSAGGAEGFVRVTTVDSLPADGKPQRFTVIADQADAWNYFPDQRIGNVFLRKTSSGDIVAYNEICPHLGCSVAYNPSAPENEAFRCPCHASAFSLDGKKSNQIPPRDLDTLEVKTEGNDVLVRYRKFRTGIPEKTEA
jgi:Rieske Fe-S protein